MSQQEVHVIYAHVLMNIQMFFSINVRNHSNPEM